MLKELVLEAVSAEESINNVDLSPSVRNIIKAKSVLNGVKKKVSDMNDSLEELKKEYMKAEGIAKNEIKPQ